MRHQVLQRPERFLFMLCDYVGALNLLEFFFVITVLEHFIEESHKVL